MTQWMFGPDSMMWKINRESVLLLGGRAALLMQLAHPLVAAGVADHSDFRRDPIKRLRRTLEITMAIIFGDQATARESAAIVNSVHEHVRGEAPDGRTYSARDPKLLLWVHETLIDSALKVYEACVGRLTEDELNRYYDETKIIAELFDIPPSIVPATLEQMRADMAARIESGEVTVTDQARELAEPIIRPLRVVPRRLARTSAFITAALLPPPIREGYGLRVRLPASLLLGAGGRASRLVLPLMPRRIRSFPVKGNWVQPSG